MSNNNNMSTQQIQQTLAEYFATQPVLKAWLFGSYARGEQREDSDVDILVALDKSQPIGLYRGYAETLCRRECQP